MDSEDIKKIIKDYAEKGYSIKVRDIMYALLRTKIDDDVIIYQSLYGIDSDINVINKYVEREDCYWNAYWRNGFKEYFCRKENIFNFFI